MVKPSKPTKPIKLNEIDKGIIAILRANARISVTEISRQLGLGESTVRYRMKRLMREGIIAGFFTLTDPKIGGVTSSLALKVSPNAFDKVIAKLKALRDETSSTFFDPLANTMAWLWLAQGI
jgi:DNA-binding Lrp family transcriptional regulator